MDASTPTLTELPWLDRPDALKQIDAKARRGQITAQQADMLRAFWRDGYLDLGCVLEPELTDAVRSELDAFLKANQHRPFDDYKVQLQNMYEGHAACRRATVAPGILAWCDLVLGTPAHPFQTLTIPFGTEIMAHVDQVFMSTDPRGYMVAAWCALEDIRPDSGPVALWKGSHRLPYLGPAEFGVQRGTPRPEATQIYNERYYALVQRRIAESGLEPFLYLPKKGQVLLWHANLIHGGSPRANKDSSRRSLVIHYFGAGARQYSDLFSEPCVLPGLRK